MLEMEGEDKYVRMRVANECIITCTLSIATDIIITRLRLYTSASQGSPKPKDPMNQGRKWIQRDIIAIMSARVATLVKLERCKRRYVEKIPGSLTATI